MTTGIAVSFLFTVICFTSDIFLNLGVFLHAAFVLNCSLEQMFLTVCFFCSDLWRKKYIL
jgi:hypothetical protein